MIQVEACLPTHKYLFVRIIIKCAFFKIPKLMHDRKATPFQVGVQFLREKHTHIQMLNRIKFTVDIVMPCYAINLGAVFILHDLLDQNFPAIFGCVLGNFLLFFFAFNNELNIRIKAIQ